MNADGSPKYAIECFIANGTFGHVFRAVELKTGQTVAWKRIPKATRVLSREFEILEQIKGLPYIISYSEIFYTVNSSNQMVQNLIFPYCDSDLEQLLKRRSPGCRPMEYINTKKMIFQLCIGLSALHTRGICHRDLKPENILHKDGRVYITDFGASKVLGKRNTPYAVSRYYRAPELFYGADDYTCSIDTWAIGVMLWEFCFGALPFRGRTEGQHLIEIYRFLGPPNREIFDEMRQVVDKWDSSFEILLAIKKSTKMDTDLKTLQIPDHEKPMLTKFIFDCFEYKYKERMFGEALVNHPYFDDLRHEKEIKFVISKF